MAYSYIEMNENNLITLESGTEDEALNLLKDFNIKVWHTVCEVWSGPPRWLKNARPLFAAYIFNLYFSGVKYDFWHWMKNK